jgi:alpha-beta hydrolase superfamily lysophospholipase
VGAQPVGFIGAGGVELWGELLARPSTVLLVHDAGRDLDAWSPLPELLAERGFGSFAFDLRGCGLSDGRPGGRGFAADVVAAAGHARSAGAREVFAVGAGSGADAVLRAAPDAGLSAVVLISPSCAGPRALRRAALRCATVPKLVIVGSQDEAAFERSRELLALCIGPRLVVELPTAAQSHALLDGACATQALEHSLTYLAHHRRIADPAPSTP